MSKSATYAHLLQSNAVAAKGAGAKEVDPNESETMEAPPANDKEDGKKAKSKAKVKAGEGDTEEDEEDKDSDEGESDEKMEKKKEKENKDRDDKEDKKSKKAAASGDMIRAAVLEERIRCATIFRSQAAAGRPHVAAQFAFHTELDAEAAIAVMEATMIDTPAAPTRRASIDERMAKVQNANVGVDFEEQTAAGPVSFERLATLSPDQRALAIVNAGRSNRGEEPLKKLPA